MPARPRRRRRRWPRSTRRRSSKRPAASEMNLTIALVAVLAIVLAAGLYAYRAAATLRRGAAERGGARLHSLPVYHALYVGLWTALPALLFLTIWAPVQSGLVDQAVLATPAGQALPAFDMQREAILSEARDIASG